MKEKLKRKLKHNHKPDYHKKRINRKAKQETYILSESSLKKEWLHPKEDEAWKDL